MPVSPTLLFALLTASLIKPAFAQNPPPDTLKTKSQLVILDVVVTDSKQNPVHNLTASDFTILENNAPEHIKSFEEHTTETATKPEPPLNLPPGNFTNYTSVPANAPLNILLIDTLNTISFAYSSKTLLQTFPSPSSVSVLISGFCSLSPPTRVFYRPPLITSLPAPLR
jgi:hypothetical protein